MRITRKYTNRIVMLLEANPLIDYFHEDSSDIQWVCITHSHPSRPPTLAYLLVNGKLPRLDVCIVLAVPARHREHRSKLLRSPPFLRPERRKQLLHSAKHGGCGVGAKEKVYVPHDQRRKNNLRTIEAETEPQLHRFGPPPITLTEFDGGLQITTTAEHSWS